MRDDLGSEPESKTPALETDDIADTFVRAEAAAPEDPAPEKAPYWRRNPVTFWFVMLILLGYGLTTYAAGFQHLPDSRTVESAPNALYGVVLFYFGSFIPEKFADGEWWRIFTAALLHANVSHLLSNIFGLVVFGNILEPVLGSGRLLLLYFIAQVGGMLLSFYALPSPSIGASAIDYGLLGTYIGLVLLLRYRQDRSVFYTELRGAFFFVLLFVASNSLQMTSINLWAHVGGFISGLAFSLLLVRKKI